jgi:hypothetical protein
MQPPHCGGVSIRYLNLGGEGALDPTLFFRQNYSDDWSPRKALHEGQLRLNGEPNANDCTIVNTFKVAAGSVRKPSLPGEIGRAGSPFEGVDESIVAHIAAASCFNERLRAAKGIARMSIYPTFVPRLLAGRA